MTPITKFVRTPHLAGSKLQPEDEDLSQIPWEDLRGKHLVVEEKIDGANSGISFDSEGNLLLQCRGHYLTGGAGERQFALFKQWAMAYITELFDILEDRYIVYGEWMYAKHSVFYDNLPHYFLEFDVWDKQESIFLSTPRRERLLDRGLITPVPVLAKGLWTEPAEILNLIGPSTYKTPEWKPHLNALVADRGLDNLTVWKQTDPSDDMEGLYLKWEDGDEVKGRYKWVRGDFVQVVQDSGSHWKSRPILPNQLRSGTSLFGQGK